MFGAGRGERGMRGVSHRQERVLGVLEHSVLCESVCHFILGEREREREKETERESGMKQHDGEQDGTLVTATITTFHTHAVANTLSTLSTLTTPPLIPLHPNHYSPSHPSPP